MPEGSEALKRKEVHFATLGIPHLGSLNRVELRTTREPIGSHTHKNQFEICVHYEGRQYYEIDGVGYETNAGDIFVSLPNEHHSTGNRGEERSSFIYFIFECMPDTLHFMGLETEASEYIISKLFSSKARVISGAYRVKPFLDDIFQIYESPHPLKKPIIQGKITQFFYELGCLITRSESQSSIPRDILFLCDYIAEHLASDLSIEHLASLIHLSKSQFQRKFKQYIYSTPHDYILRQRINLAKNMLLYTFTPITQIAFDVGMSSSQSFAKVFKMYAGKTPSSFRKNRKEELLIWQEGNH